MEDILRYKKYEPFFGSWYFEDSHREIGSGSFGSVYRIVRHDTNVRPSALKIITIPGKQAELESLRFQGMSEMDIWQYYSQMAEDIKKEYELMSELKGCDNIVSCEDFISFRRKDKLGFDIMIRMELLMPLINYRAETQREIGEGEVVKLGIDICQALEKCQVSHIIHRDIKPENIFISQYGNFKLGDFGIARTIEKTDMLMSRKGTKNYMAPEVFNSQPYDLTADIYSLGIVLYQLLNDNCPPFLDVVTARSADAREQAFIHRIKGKELEAPAHGSEMLVEIILKACRFEKGERYQSPQEFRAELEKLPVSEIDMSGIDIFEVKGKSGTDATELLQKNDGSTFLLQGEEEGTHLLSRNATDLLRPADGGTGVLESDGTELLSMDSAADRSRKRKIAIGGAAAAVLLAGGIIAGVIMGGGSGSKEGIEASNTVAAVQQGHGDAAQAADGTAVTSADTGAQNEGTLSEEQLIEQRKTVTELNGKDLEKFSDLPDYENLEILDLSQMKVKDISILKNLKNLKDLNISYTNVEDISVLQSCEKLTALDISYNNENMTEKKIMTVLASLTGLKELNITGDMVAGDYEEELAKLKNLEILWAGSTGIADGGFLKSLKNLKVLDLDANLSFGDLGKITGLTRLEELNLSATGITNLKGIERLENLKICNISLTDITDISVLKNCKNLKEVTVSESPQMKKQVKQLKTKLKNCKFELI